MASRQRKCSLAIESPDSTSSNNPLNAFLVYQESSNESAIADSTDSVHLMKSHSWPNLNNEDFVVTNRRVSLCDLNNFNDELQHLTRRNSTNSSQAPTHLAQSTSNLLEDSVESPFGDFYSYSFEPRTITTPRARKKSDTSCRNHFRRNSIALKFENPKVID
ncbi:hypothetical protein G9P44_000052 [Scheffersomyces stipitis]|nr:hypothetical protein G9P44_000052 [Scheffersomyces stipitis]